MATLPMFGLSEATFFLTLGFHERMSWLGVRDGIRNWLLTTA